MPFKYDIIYVVSFIGIFFSIFFIMTLIENIRRVKNPPLKSKPFVSVIIPAYNEAANIKKTIESVQNLNYPAFEIIVVDDGSKDDTFKIAKKVADKDDRIKVFTKPNGGKASAMNFGIKRAKGDYIATLDADSFVTTEALNNLMSHFSDPTVASVTPSLKVYRPKGFYQRVQQIEYLFGIFYRKIFSFLNVLHVTPGPFSVYKKSFFEKHGMFDENNPTEDTEIALRIQTHHYKIENSIDAVVYTVAPKTFKELLTQRIRWYHGLVKNLENYMHLFNPKYGYLALFALPAALLSVVLIIAIVGYFSYIGVEGMIRGFVNWYLVGFDFWTMLQGFKPEYLYYQFTSPVTFLLILLVIFNMLFIYVAKYKSNDKDGIKLSYMYFFGSYAYLYAIWWVMALFYRVFGRIKWKGRTYG